MTESQDRSCKTCRHFHSSGDGNGDCTRYPPMVLIWEDRPSTQYPQVSITETCGEWELPWKEKEKRIEEILKEGLSS